MMKHNYLNLITAILLSLSVVSLFACTTTSPSSTAPGGQGSSTTSGSATTGTSTTSSITSTTKGNSTTATTSIVPGITISPQPNITLPAFSNSQQYVVFTWNELGMHCANPSYDVAVILPPYNTVRAQVVKRGNPPVVVSDGLTVTYEIVNNTYTYGKGLYGQFWDNAQKLFGIDLARDTGLNLDDPAIHNGLSGAMVNKGTYFVADGIPLSPYYDNSGYNPYQIGHIVVKDTGGAIVAQTYTTIPVSDEINCAKCHGADGFQDALQKHDARNGTNLVSQEPVLCASCHADPVLNATGQAGVKTLSEAIHGFHSAVNPEPNCLDCHPGVVTKCQRSIQHTDSTGKCTTCHGDLSQMSSSVANGRTPWFNEPECVTCHTGVTGVDTGTNLYRNSAGHGNLNCSACHGSPHAMVPTTVRSDAFQSLQYQGNQLTIGDCRTCHSSSRGGGDIDEFSETHAGSNPEHTTACNICHTAVSASTSSWPHHFQWKSRRQPPTTTTTPASGP